MSGACVGSSTDWRQQYDSVWHADFEYREDANYHPVPVSMFAFEQHSGTEISCDVNSCSPSGVHRSELANAICW